MGQSTALNLDWLHSTGAQSRRVLATAAAAWSFLHAVHGTHGPTDSFAAVQGQGVETVATQLAEVVRKGEQSVHTGLAADGELARWYLEQMQRWATHPPRMS